MQNFTFFVNSLWGILAIISQILSVSIIIAFLTPTLRNSKFINFFREKGILVAFIVSLLATVGSLIYSDVIGYDPCKLCWFQRIFMYPQVILMGIALWRKDMSMAIYGAVLSIIGAAVALFHYVGQLGWNPFALECLAVGYSSSCSKNFVLQYGYITIPIMAFSAFLLMSITLIISLWRKQ